MKRRILIVLLCIVIVGIGSTLFLYKIDLRYGAIHIEKRYPKDRSFSPEKIEESNLIVMISNQSIDNPEIKIKGYINKEQLFNDSFEVGNQHLASYYYLDLEEGEYNLSFESEDDAILSDVITVDEEQIWVIVTYWKDNDSDPHMNIFSQNEPFFLD